MQYKIIYIYIIVIYTHNILYIQYHLIFINACL